MPDEEALKFPRPPSRFLHEPRLFLAQFCVLSFAENDGALLYVVFL